MTSAANLLSSDEANSTTWFEAAFCLYLCSAAYKPVLSELGFPVDATLMSGAVVAAGVAWHLMRSHKAEPRWVGVVAPFAVFFCYVLSTSAWSTAPDIAAKRILLGAPLSALAFLSGAAVIAGSPQRLARVARVFSMVAVALALMVLLSAYSLVPVNEGYVHTRIVRSTSIALGVPLLVLTALSRQRSLAVSAVAMVAVGACVLAILVSGSRQSLLGVAVSVALVIWMTASSRAASAKKVLVVVLGAPLIVVAVASQFEFELSTIERLRILLEGRLGQSAGMRVQSLRNALDASDSAPFFGHGLGSFGQLYGYNPNDHPHNILVEALFDGGVVGLLLLTLVLALVLRRWLRHRGSLPLAPKVFVACAGVTVAVVASVSSTIVEDRLLWGVLSLCALSTSGSGDDAREMLSPVGTNLPSIGSI